MKAEDVRNLVERVILLPKRLQHRRNARPKFKARQDALTTTRNTLRRAGEIRAESIKTIFNVGLYLLLLDQDLADFTDDLVNAIGDRRRRFIAKHEAALLYESAEDLPQLLGKEFRDAAKAIGVGQDVIDRLNAVSSELNQFWKENRAFLGTIRNALVAHREHDTLKYLEMLEELTPLDVMSRAADFSARLERLIRVLSEIGLVTANPTTILKDVVKSGESQRSQT